VFRSGVTLYDKREDWGKKMVSARSFYLDLHGGVSAGAYIESVGGRGVLLVAASGWRGMEAPSPALMIEKSQPRHFG